MAVYNPYSSTSSPAPSLQKVGVASIYPQAPTNTSPNPFQGAPEIGPPTTVSSPIDIQAEYDKFASLFGPSGSSIDPMKVAQDIQSISKSVPTVTAPTVSPAKINFAQGAQLQESAYQGEFAPVQRELTRQMGLADQAVAGQTAQAGLAESGAGLALRRRVQREGEQRLEDASTDAAHRANVLRIQTEHATAVRNAEFEQQAKLTNAGFDFEAQKVNAANILAGNSAAAQGYIAALGIDKQSADAYRAAFLNYLSERERNTIARDTAAFDRYATLFNLMLQQKKIDSDMQLAQDAQKLAARELGINEQLEQDRLALAEQELIANQQLAERDARLKELSAGADVFGSVYQGNAELGQIAADLTGIPHTVENFGYGNTGQILSRTNPRSIF